MSNEGRRWLNGMVKCWPVISPTIQETICKSQYSFIVVTYGGFVCIFSCPYINTDFFFIILLTYSCSYLLSSHRHFVLFALLLNTMIHKYIIEDGGGEGGRR